MLHNREETSKNRFELVNKLACAGFQKAYKFYKKKEAMVAKEYNIDEIRMRILNGGDGASWIHHGIDHTVYYQLDPFHKNLGTMEHYICDIIAQRMKHRKASWSIKDARQFSKTSSS